MVREDLPEFGFGILPFKSGVITADWHLRSTVPQCAGETKEEWMEVQRKAVNEIIDICLKYHYDLFVVGDLYHKVDDISFECVTIVQTAAKRLEEAGLKFYFLAGNHDLKYHSSSNLYKSAIGVLVNSENCNLLTNKEFSNVAASNFDEELFDNEFVFRHVLCMPGKDKLPWIDCYVPETLGDEYKKAKVIFTGDYHKHFTFVEEGSPSVINPGCLTIQVSDMIDYQPGCYVYHEDGTIDWNEIKVERKFLDLTSTVKKDESIDTFVSAVENSAEVSLDFISNLEKRIALESEEVKETIHQWT